MIIKHKRFKDVAFQTLDELGPVMHGRWINMGYTKSWYLPCPLDKVEIKDRQDWERCVNPSKVVCLRDGDWAPL